MIRAAINRLIKKFDKRIILKDVFTEDEWRLTQPYGDTEYSRELEQDYQEGKYDNRVYPYIWHIGLDWAGKPKGFPIKAAHDGPVVFAGKNSRKKARGIYVSIWDTQQEIATISLHMNDIAVRKNDFVKAGDVIGFVGETGWCDGVHCHLGLYYTKNGYILTSLPYGGSINPKDKKLVRMVK